MALVKGCSAILSFIEGMFPISGLLVDFAKKHYTVKANGLLICAAIRAMIKKRHCFSVETELPSAASLSDRCLGFVKKSNLAKTIVFYMEIVNRLLLFTKKQRGRPESWKVCGQRFRSWRKLLRDCLCRTAHLVYLH